ncbi:flagellar hook-length control protein FliK [Pseudomonas sp. NCCP-436]|uniref:flagellar hook-length control protein FliK n=1 Tax=Pseudomonas sp. NCCP-436 TaxID=2842481 RepID=UPI001C816979|nr:flagellar hook-length control protein FliK [Pseudomonas sp. NCCP-436]GIZ12173.1 flagellar hook-length control protein FliK [Pseudomonas sp. NCCP-436]
MSALPELRLQAPPEAKSKVQPSARALEPSRNKGSSFSEVYEQERQGRSVERSEGAKHNDAATGRPAGKAAEPAAEQSDVADTGNALPDAEDAPQVLDPLLAMALAGELQSEMPPEPDGGNLGEQLQLDAEASLDPKSQLADQGRLLATRSERTGRGDFAAAMSAMALEDGAQGEEAPTELHFDSPSEGLESQKESVEPSRADPLAGRLSILAQAVGQQSVTAQRLPLVPGQPLIMQQAGWSEALVERVMWLSSQNLQSAEIQLDPAELGRLEVRVNLTQDQAQVSFASANAGVREALEGQMHRLRELFTQQGMNLADANVSDHAQGREGQEAREGRARASSADESLFADERLSEAAERMDTLRAGRGLVDYYA